MGCIPLAFACPTTTMKVLLKTGRATEEQVWKPGEECEITDEAEALRLIEAGDAEPVVEKRSDRRETRVRAAESGSQ